MSYELTDKARSYFDDKGLTYKDVTEGDIGVLFILLNKHVKKACSEGKMSTNAMRMSSKVKAKYNPNGSLKECYLFLNSDYFTQREAISFNSNGFIGFAGWADSTNKAPLVNAFIEWVDVITDTHSDRKVE